MAATSVDICNLALAKIGNTSFIGALSDVQVEAFICNLEYPQVRDTALERLSPPFATKRAVLVEAAETRTEWDFVYDLPVGFLAVQAIVDPTTRLPDYDLREPYDIEQGATGARVLLTNQEDCEIIYTDQTTDVTLWPSTFVDVVVYGLAAALALSIKKDANLATKLGDVYTMKLGEAHGTAQTQRNLGPSDVSSILRARY